MNFDSNRNSNSNSTNDSNSDSDSDSKSNSNSRLRTNGVSTNGAAAKVMDVDGWGKRYALALLGI